MGVYAQVISGLGTDLATTLTKELKINESSIDEILNKLDKPYPVQRGGYRASLSHHDTKQFNLKVYPENSGYASDVDARLQILQDRLDFKRDDVLDRGNIHLRDRGYHLFFKEHRVEFVYVDSEQLTKPRLASYLLFAATLMDFIFGHNKAAKDSAKPSQPASDQSPEFYELDQITGKFSPYTKGGEGMKRWFGGEPIMVAGRGGHPLYVSVDNNRVVVHVMGDYTGRFNETELGGLIGKRTDGVWVGNRYGEEDKKSYLLEAICTDARGQISAPVDSFSKGVDQVDPNDVIEALIVMYELFPLTLHRGPKPKK